MGLGRTLKRVSNFQLRRVYCVRLYELQEHEPWFDEECLRYLDQRKHAKMQWVHDPKQSNVDSLNNIRRGARIHFRKKKNI